MIVFLVWLWITNTVILLGAELNAEIERGRQIEGGTPRRSGAVPTAAARAETLMSGNHHPHERGKRCQR